MKPEDKWRLQSNRVPLADDLDVKYFLNPLIATGILDIDDDERIKNEATRKDKTEKLLNILMQNSHPDTYKVFYEELKKQYPHLSDKLDATDLAKMPPPKNALSEESQDYPECPSLKGKDMAGNISLKKTGITENRVSIKGSGNIVISGGDGASINFNRIPKNQ